MELTDKERSLLLEAIGSRIGHYKILRHGAENEYQIYTDKINELYALKGKILYGDPDAC